MKTYCTSAAVTLALVTATGAMAASPDADNTAPTFIGDAVVTDLLVSRQASPTLPPRDGEWYNVPAPLGSMDPMAPTAVKVRYEEGGSARAMPVERAGEESGRK